MKKHDKGLQILLISFSVLGIFFAISMSEGATIDVPLIVQEALPSGVTSMARVNEPVTVGVPLEESSGLTNASQLGLSGASAGQFRILARWPNGNVKWVLVDFQTSVPAGGTTTATLTGGTGNFGGNNLAADSGATIDVNTGLAQFRIKRANFNVFDEVVVNGQTLSSGGTGQLIMRDSSNNVYTSTNDASSTAVIEENGPVRAVVKADGSFKDSAGNRLMDYTLRMHFYKGKSYVKAIVTLRNARKAYPSHAFFNSVEAVIPTTISSPTVEFARKNDVATGSISSSQTAYMFQGFSYDKLLAYKDGSINSPTSNCDIWNPPVAGGCNFDPSQSGLAIVIGGSTLSSLGNRDDWTQGFGEIRDSSGKGLTTAIRWMSAYWPAGLEFQGDGSASIELFSKRNTKTGLKMLFGKHEQREILWDFHTQSVNNNAVLYNLQYPLIARADFAQYQKSRAIYGQSEFPTPQQEVKFFSDLGRSDVFSGNTNPAMKVFRVWNWPEGGGGNQIDFPLGDLQDYLRTGLAGFYLTGEQRTLFNGNTAVRHSDDYTLDIVNSGWAQDDISGLFFDMQHAHMMSMPFYYFISGNEGIKESVLDYGELLDRMQITGDYPLPTMEYFRAWSRKYRNFGLIYEFSCQIGTCNNRYKSYVEEATNYLLDSRDNSSDGYQHGRNLDRGYIYWDTEDFASYGRVIHSFFHTQIHFEAMWQALRIMNDLGWNYARKEELEDYMLGLAQFFFDEYYVEQNGGQNLYDFGITYDYPLDRVQVLAPSYDAPGGWQNAPLPYDMSRAAVFGYQRTGNTRYLDRANKMVWGVDVFATSRNHAELQDQALIYGHFTPPTQMWKSLNITVQNNGGGSYTVSWTVPTGAKKYQIKYSDKPIVDWLWFDKQTRTYSYNPSQYSAFFAAQNVNNEPTPATAGSTQSMTITGLSTSKSWYFAAKYLEDLANVAPHPPAAPTKLRTR